MAAHSDARAGRQSQMAAGRQSTEAGTAKSPAATASGSPSSATQRRPSFRLPEWCCFSCLPLIEVLQRPTPAQAGAAGASAGAAADAGAVAASGPDRPAPTATARTAEAATAPAVAAAAPVARAAPVSPASTEAHAVRRLRSGAGQHLPLDVGFARIEFREVEDWPRHEFWIASEPTATTEAGFEALLDFLGFVLDLPEACTGFVLVYDLRQCGRPQLDVIERIACWSAEADRQAKWQQRCLSCKIAVPSGTYFQMARLIMNAYFYLIPPRCETYLVTDPRGPPGDDAVVYEPDRSAQGEECHNRFQPVEWPRRERPNDPTEAVQSPKAPTEADGPLPDWITVGFADVGQGFDEAKGIGFLKIIGRDGELSDEGLFQMMDFMDAFVFSERAAKGFSITYDMRALRTPSMALVTRVAEWGGEPTRQKMWERLNVACKVVVNAGVRYTLCKGVLCTFFYICPPVCRTFLLTDPDQDEDAATVFEPVPKNLPEPVEDFVPLPRPPPQGGPPPVPLVIREPSGGTMPRPAQHHSDSPEAVVGQAGAAQPAQPDESRRQRDENMPKAGEDQESWLSLLSGVSTPYPFSTFT